MMRFLLIMLALFALALAAPVPARAQAMEDCLHPPKPDIASLQTCVQHAADAAHIDNRGIARSLLAKLNAAQAALDRKQTEVALKGLEAFIRELDAQTGKHIGAEHATHLRMHAQDVIAAFGG